MTPQEFLDAAVQAAKEAGHIFPEYAACEAALESAWGRSRLAVEGNNLFGRKVSKFDENQYEEIDIPTREFLHGEWVIVPARWVKYPDWKTCFDDRMYLLRRLDCYGPALVAGDGETFVRLVSIHWATDPARADKVLAIYDHHFKGATQ